MQNNCIFKKRKVHLFTVLPKVFPNYNVGKQSQSWEPTSLVRFDRIAEDGNITRDPDIISRVP